MACEGRWHVITDKSARVKNTATTMLSCVHELYLDMPIDMRIYMRSDMCVDMSIDICQACATAAFESSHRGVDGECRRIPARALDTPPGHGRWQVTTGRSASEKKSANPMMYDTSFSSSLLTSPAV